MQKSPIKIGNRFSKVTFAIIILTVLTLVLVVTPLAKADSPTLTVNPAQGAIGDWIQVTATGFPPSSTLTFKLDTITVGPTTGTMVQGNGQASPGTGSMAFQVPTHMSLGAHTLTATDSVSGSATASFTVTSVSSSPSPSATQAPISTPSGTNSGNSGNSGTSPTATPRILYATPPVTTSSSGFWSPLTIAITAVIVGLVAFGAFMFVNRGRQPKRSYREDSRYEPRPSAPPQAPPTPSRYGQPPTRSQPQPYSSSRSSQTYTPYYAQKTNQPPSSYSTYSSSRTSQSSSYSPQAQAPYTRVCRNCKRAVRDDQNICPYCSKRTR